MKRAGLSAGLSVTQVVNWLVVPHPTGNFTAVPGPGTVDYSGHRPPTMDDPAFYLLEDAIAYAESQCPADGFVSFHPSVLWVSYSRLGVRWYKFRRRLRRSARDLRVWAAVILWALLVVGAMIAVNWLTLWLTQGTG